MKNTIKRYYIILVVAIITVLTTACGKIDETPSVTFGFKNVDTAAEYNESLTTFEVGKRFFSSIRIQINTNKKKKHDYKVEVTVPKTDEVDVKNMGGLNPDTIVWDEANQRTVLTYTIQGSREAIPEKILFYGTPTDEGQVEMEVHIYDENGKEINAGYSRTIFFEYELQKEEW